MKKKIIIALSVVVGVFVIGSLLPAGAFSNFYGMQTVRLYKEFLFYNSTGTQKFAIDNNGTVTGSRGYLADTSSFSGALFTKAIYIPGATYSDIFVVTSRVLPGTSTAYQVDSCKLGYMVKPDSLIVWRNPIGTTPVSGGKFSWVRIQ